MQLYALDENNQLVPANRALKQKNYICLECNKQVRLRGGMHRQNHYYHREPTRTCKLGGKSLVHLSIQSYFQSLFHDCILEHRFPKINRIADVVWVSKKIIFEVQVSGITAEEVEHRNRDYSSQGYQVIWILHDKRFKRNTAAEIFLQNSPHYYTNGKGQFYDQLERTLKFSIDLTQPLKPKKPIFRIPKKIEERIRTWPISFSGDIISQVSNRKHKTYFDKFLEESKKTTLKDLWRRWVVRPYFIFFQILLEKACKN